MRWYFLSGWTITSIKQKHIFIQTRWLRLYRGPICTYFALISFPDHEAALCVNVPDTNVSSIGGGEQQGVHVVAQSCQLHITQLCRCFHPLDLQGWWSDKSLYISWCQFSEKAWGYLFFSPYMYCGCSSPTLLVLSHTVDQWLCGFCFGNYTFGLYKIIMCVFCGRLWYLEVYI